MVLPLLDLNQGAGGEAGDGAGGGVGGGDSWVSSWRPLDIDGGGENDDFVAIGSAEGIGEVEDCYPYPAEDLP